MTHSAQRQSQLELHDGMPSLVLGRVTVWETSQVVQGERVGGCVVD